MVSVRDALFTISVIRFTIYGVLALNPQLKLLSPRFARTGAGLELRTLNRFYDEVDANLLYYI
jgi:hypothetical protein